MSVSARHMATILRAAVLGTLALACAPASAAPPPSVIELFTSQGCSSCPPADALLETLATEPNLIAVSLPVDYWDYLGWKDTFAKPAFTQRQRAYSLARGDRQVYTPQAVINGRFHANGASRSEIAAAIADTAASPDIAITLERVADGVRVSVPAVTPGGASRVGAILALPIIGRREVAIGRGENARTKVAYTNIARDVVSLGTWSGSKVEVTVSSSTLADADGLVVLLQSGSPARPGPILSAAHLVLK